MIRSRMFEADNAGGGSAGAFFAVLTLVVSLILLAMPRLFGSIPVPLFPVMVVVFWTVARPGLLPPLLVFFAGLVLDLLTWTPLGFWALALLTASGVARLIRPYVLGADIWRRLSGVAAATAAVALAAVIAFGAAGRPMQAGGMQILQLILTVLTYPLLEAVLSALAKGAGMGRGRA